MFTDEYFMKIALKEAQLAFEKDEIPVGCIIVNNNKIIAKSHNLTELLNDVTAHAEMQAITAAANYISGKYLTDCNIYITLEPCEMCAGAIKWARLNKIVFGAYDINKGFINNNIKLKNTEIIGGILEKECSELLKTFFKFKRD